MSRRNMRRGITFLGILVALAAVCTPSLQDENAETPLAVSVPAASESAPIALTSTPTHGASTPTYEDQEATFEHDAALMATQTGMSPDDARDALAFQDAFTFYGIEVLTPLEDEISAIWVDPAPATRGYVRFVSEVPEHARAEAKRRGLDIVLIGGGEISMAEHDLRSDLTASALVAAGYQNFIVYSDRQQQVIKIELMLPEGSPAPDIDELAPLIRRYVSMNRGSSLKGRAAEIQTSDLELIILRGSGPIVEFD